MSDGISSDTTSNDAEVPNYELAFQETAQERAELFPADLLQVNFDIPQAVNTVYAAVGRLLPLRQQIIDTFKTYDIAQFDRLRTYAQALSCAHVKRTRPSASSELLTRRIARATEMRDQFLMDATTLASRGVINRNRLDELKGGNGFLAVAYDLARLVDMLKERWPAVQASSGVKQTEIDEAGKLFQLITDENAERNQQTTAGSSANDDRTRAYTLLIKVYEQTRSAVAYVRREEGDVDKIVPSLWATRHKGPTDQVDPIITPDVQPAPAAQPTSPVVQPAPVVKVNDMGGSPFGGN